MSQIWDRFAQTGSPRTTLRVAELCGGLATCLEALLRAGCVIRSYTWVDTYPGAHMAAAQRIACLRHNFPHLFLPEAVQDWDSRLPLDVRTSSPDLLSATFLEGIYLILASPPVLATRVSRSHREHTPSGPDIHRPAHHTPCPPPLRVTTRRGRIYLGLL